MKFIERGAVRLESTGGTRSLANVAFRNPNGSVVLVLVNNANREQAIRLSFGKRSATAMLPENTVATLMWQAH